MKRQYILGSMLGTLACALLALSAVTRVQAADEKKADASGTWTWTVPGRDGGPGRQSTAKLKVEGDKLMGTVSSPGRQGAEPRETAIENGKVKGDEISFTVTREFQGNKFTQKFMGKVSGDSIKGKIESERNGQPMSRDWDAKRSTEKAAKPEQK
ncbi:MAG: hypothetical protein U1G07_09390 [Verrucomicrobiota bacterium]